MSGGHFDYAYVNVNQFCDILKRNIRDNKKKDDFGYAANYSKDTIKELKKILKEAEKLSKLMYHTEWLMSGDDSEETFLKQIKEIK